MFIFTFEKIENTKTIKMIFKEIDIIMIKIVFDKKLKLFFITNI